MMKTLVLFVVACVAMPQIVCSGIAEVRQRLEGIWLGSLAVPDAQVRLAYRVIVVSEDSLFVVHDSLDYGHLGIPVQAAGINGKHVTFDIGLFDASYRGKVRGERIIGWYRAGASRTPLNLKRVSRDPHHRLDYMVPRLDAVGDPCLDYRYSVPAARDDGWPTAHAADVGIDLRLIDELVRHILRGDYHGIQALLIVKDGKLVVEEYFYGLDAGSLHPIYSITKNVIYNTAGIALEKGILADLDQPIAEFFPEYAPILAEPGKEKISLRHLVSMSSGLAWDEVSTSYFDAGNSLIAAKASGNLLAYALSQPLGNAPGVAFAYNSALPHVVAEIVSRSADVPFTSYVGENLFDPLGIEKYRWDDGIGVLHLRARDLAKLGYLNTHRGRSLEVRIVPEWWFAPSMNDSTRCDHPFYWNHWGQEEFFVAGRPVAGYSQGGFGGQLNFGFPDLDLVVTMFAGNYRNGTAVDQHEMVREFILPAVVGAEAEHAPSVGGSPDTAIDLTWARSQMTRVGCMQACLDYFGREFSEAWVFGATGYAFALNIEGNAHSRSVGVWRSDKTLRLFENLGVTIETISAHGSQPNFEEVQRRAWDKTRAALDEGNPCVGFHMKDHEWYVINGYDRQGYYYQGKDLQVPYGPKCWQEMGTRDPNWLEVHIVRPGDPENETRVVKAALEFALDIAFSPEKYQHQGFKAGVAGYDQWIEALREDRHHAYGVAANAAAWAECRRHAVDFLVEARVYMPDDVRSFLDDAREYYAEVAGNLAEVSGLFPLAGVCTFELEANARDRDRRQQAIRYLELARDAEIEGLAALKNVVDSR